MMLIRIVKMTFVAGHEKDFLAEFHQKKSHIAGFEGCLGVELLQDIHQPQIFFTYSRWKDEASLEAYRSSALFAGTWQTVKQWFAARPEAWSVKTVE